MDTEPIELRPGLPGYWNYQPNKGPVWWGVAEDRPNRFEITEYDDRRPMLLNTSHAVSSLDEARRWIGERVASLPPQ